MLLIFKLNYGITLMKVSLCERHRFLYLSHHPDKFLGFSSPKIAKLVFIITYT